MKTTTNEFKTFLKLSEKLTAFTAFELQGTGMAEHYYMTLGQVLSNEHFTDLLTTFESVIQSNSNEKAIDQAFRHKILSNKKRGPIARNIIKLWFIGTWYQLPASWLEEFGMQVEENTFVVSPTAYQEGLLWRTIGAHPMGAKAPGYGTWAKPPEIPTF